MREMRARSGASGLPAWLQWTGPGRAIVFFLSAMSIWCLLAEFYGLCSMRLFTLYVLLPATLVLIAIAVVNGLKGDRRIARAVMVGSIGGFLAAIAYDVFRLPFVFSHQWGLSSIVPPMDLFKVFPRFGAMILGQPVEQAHYGLDVQLLGWAYHFSNGITFGIMYLAAIGDATRRSWAWAIVMAVGLELAMLFTPYTQFFGIHPAALFVVVTLTAHLIFGIVMGLMTRRMERRWQPAVAV